MYYLASPGLIREGSAGSESWVKRARKQSTLTVKRVSRETCEKPGLEFLFVRRWCALEAAAIEYSEAPSCVQHWRCSLVEQKANFIIMIS